ncbi:MAG TPA: DUF4926 domain-containing protein [Pseudonocardiaceae bacterium]|nr:DUF4926 domain-containing protein [Pseudonocardiaceae bacterium]
MTYQQFDLVKLVHGVPADGIPAGTVAVIVEIYDQPEPHYEVEVTTDDDTLYTVGVTPAEIEPASAP